MFKIGDTVIGNDQGQYGVTVEGWVGVVTNTYLDQYGEPAARGYDNIEVQALKGDDMCRYWVNSEHFNLYLSVSKPKKVKKRYCDWKYA